MGEQYLGFILFMDIDAVDGYIRSFHDGNSAGVAFWNFMDGGIHLSEAIAFVGAYGAMLRTSRARTVFRCQDPRPRFDFG